MMRTTLAALAAGAAATLAATLALPPAAQAATIRASAVPAPQKSLTVAGYQQVGCNHSGYPVYIEMSGTINIDFVR